MYPSYDESLCFVPREKPADYCWWKECIRSRPDEELDANPKTSICASTNFTSAAIFPFELDSHQTETSTTYLYAIAAPAAVKIDINKEIKLENEVIPALHSQMAIDLHSFQAEEISEKLEHLVTSQVAPLLHGLGFSLYAYEILLLPLVLRQNIIGAVEIKRGPQWVEGIKPHFIPYREFKVEQFVYQNDNFNAHQSLLASGPLQKYFKVNIDYSKQQQEVLEFLQKAHLTKTWRTFRVKDGFMGKTFELTPCFFGKISPPICPTNQQQSNQQKNSPYFGMTTNQH